MYNIYKINKYHKGYLGKKGNIYDKSANLTPLY